MPPVSTIWLLPMAAFGILTIVSVLATRRLGAELRATAQRLTAVADAAAAVRADVERVRAAVDSLDVPSLRQAAAERALGAAARWAARRVLPF